MPEIPDVMLYLEALENRIKGHRLERVRLASPFLLRSVEPSLKEFTDKRVTNLRRLGKRIVIGLEDELFLVVHLMIAGRFRWKPRKSGELIKIPARLGLGAFDFSEGTLLLTEASKKKRASLYAVRGEAQLAAHDPGGIDPLEASFETFRDELLRENHTLKRALTDQRLFSGIGNAYSDEILHRARLSPMRWTTKLSDEEQRALYEATRSTLAEWLERLRAKSRGRFPDKVTAFHDEMATHGKFRQPCPVCGTSIQRIIYAENETNYCPQCQTEGKILADRSLSRLLKKDWPKNLDELESFEASKQRG